MDMIPNKLKELFFVSLACNNDSNLETGTGSKTDHAILEFLEKRGIGYKEYREKYMNDKTIIFSFSSERKRMGVIVPIQLHDENQNLLIEKGGAELILESSSHIYQPNVTKLFSCFSNS